CITSINQREDLKPIEVIEKEHILRTLQEVNFNKKRAAQLLGIPLRTFYRKLKKYGIE
ncbi:MAG TPA: sigma-54-dependent Fis family transcriptional regulator, partial [Aquificaceae bacterium]|nr:sigma-54-dependent Fis family transcriptional regulator [Aquificaceae bacterium]